jgi:hypothetical protein
MSAPLHAPLPIKLVPATVPPHHFEGYEWHFRGFVVLLLAVSVTLGWWSLKRLIPLQRKCAELNATVSRVSREVDELQRRWSEEDAVRIRQMFTQAHAQLFVDQAALDGWLASLKNQVIPLGLDLKTDFGKSVPQRSSNDLAIIPTTVSVEVRPPSGNEKTESAYQRILRLSHRLSTQPKRADLAELKVSAAGDSSINSAVMVLNLWAGEEHAQ